MKKEGEKEIGIEVGRGKRNNREITHLASVI